MTKIPPRDPVGGVTTLATVSIAVATPSLVITIDPLVGSLLGLTVLIIILIVVYPAVWSKRETRRDAALAVLDRIFRRH